MKADLKKKWLFPVLVFVSFLLIWEILYLIFKPPSYLIPSPLDMVEAFRNNISLIPKDVAITSLEAVLGFLLGSIFAISVGILFALFKTLEISFMPYAIALKSVPIVAIAPLLVIWFGFGIFAKIVLSASICFFPVLIGTVQGLRDLDSRSLDLFRSLAATKWQIFKWLRVPNALSHIFSSFRVAIVFSVIGAIVAEFAGAKNGIGFRILIASYNIETATMFIYIIISALLGIVLYGIIAFLSRLLISWEETF